MSSSSSSAAIASELTRRMSASRSSADGGQIDSERALAADSDSDTGTHRMLSDLVEATLGDDLTRLAESIVNPDNGGGDKEEAAAAEETRNAADQMIKSSTYSIIRDAAVMSAQEVNKISASSADDNDNTIRISGNNAKHDDAAAKKKMKRNSDDEEESSAVWGGGSGSAGDDNNYEQQSSYPQPSADPFASTSDSTTAPAATTKSFSLFDMLDSQQAAAPMHVDRVSAEQILEIFASTAISSDHDGSSSTISSQDKYTSAASLFERVDDMEDLLFDPFGGGGGGDIWPDINRVLRRGLGMAPLEDEDSSTSDIIIRYAQIHSHLDGLCGQSSSTGIDFAPQRVGLATNLADGIKHLHDNCWYKVDAGEVRLTRDMAVLIQTLLDLLMNGAALALEMVTEEDCNCFLSSMMSVLAAKSTVICPAHAVAAADPYADWFTLVGRLVQPTALVRLSIETGMLNTIVQRCNEVARISVNSVADASNCADRDVVAVGTTSDLDHCLFLQSLSILRTVLVATAGSDTLFPYQPSGSKDQLCEVHILRFLSPFVKVLDAGVKEGNDVVDESLATICEEASETILRGIMNNKQIFGAVFKSSVAPIAGTISTSSGLDGFNSSSEAIRRLQQVHASELAS